MGDGGIWTAIRTFARADRRTTVALVTVATVGGLAGPALVLATGALVDAIRSGASAAVPLAVLTGVFVVQRVLDPVREELGRVLWRRVDEQVTQRVMVAMATPPGVAHVEDGRVADLVAEAQGVLTDHTPGEAAAAFAGVWMLAIQGVGAVAIVGAWRWEVAAALAAACAAGYAVARWHWYHVGLVLYHRTDRLRDAFYLRTVALSPVAAKETRVFGLSSWLVEGYRSRWLAVMTDIWRKRREGWLAAVGVVAGLAVVEGVTLVLLADDALGRRLSVGAAVAVAQAVLSAGRLTHFNDGHWMVAECARAVRRVEALEDAAGAAGAEAGVAGGERDADGLPSVNIRFEGVTFRYPGRADPVLDGFDLDIEAGTSIAIVGENGAGKTTLVKLLARLYDPTGGRITVDGLDLRRLSPAAWQRRVAAVFQDFVQFELSARDNVAFGALDRYGDGAAIASAAAEAGALAVVEALPGGWDTPLSRQLNGGAELSGGQWQRLALARALFAVRAGAGVLVLDEPTASLDVRAEADIYDRFLELTRGITTVVISHRFSTVRRADRIVVVEHGRIVEDGTHAELVAANGRYAAMYALQAMRFTEGGGPARSAGLGTPRTAVGEVRSTRAPTARHSHDA